MLIRWPAGQPARPVGKPVRRRPVGKPEPAAVAAAAANLRHLSSGRLTRLYQIDWLPSGPAGLLTGARLVHCRRQSIYPSRQLALLLAASELAARRNCQFSSGRSAGKLVPSKPPASTTTTTTNGQAGLSLSINIIASTTGLHPWWPSRAVREPSQLASVGSNSTACSERQAAATATAAGGSIGIGRPPGRAGAAAPIGPEPS